MSSFLGKQDVEILKLLQRDATISTAAIAERINLSQSPCWRRINRMEEEGLIQRRVVLLDRARLGMEVVVFATINLTSTGRQNLMSFEQDIVRHPEVMECYTMTGIWDYMLKIVTRDIRHYEDFVRNTLTASPAIRELHSHMAVTEIKNSTELPLDTQL
ncbi:MAG: Lrp/AsnC family transcriptional regulator [Haliea sp.]|uniref:Lrp/AsnC family transcriptional regulator n=1 Tax=Haliea sp. TaxID=1932666 RepID=UPI0032EC8C6A